MEVNHNALQAELHDIDAQRQAFSGGDGQVEEGNGQQLQEGQAQETGNRPEYVTGVLQLTLHLFEPIFPSLAQVYTPDVVAEIGVKTVAVADKRGWNLANMLGQWREELELAFVLVPVMVSSYKAVAHDIEARQAAAAESEKKAEEGGEGAKA